MRAGFRHPRSVLLPVGSVIEGQDRQMGYTILTSELVLTFLALVVLTTLLLGLVAVARRRQQEKYFARFDELRKVCEPTVQGLLNGTHSVEESAALLRTHFGADCAFAVEKMLLRENLTQTQVPRVRQLCEALGVVSLWRNSLNGRSEKKPLYEALAAPNGIVDRFDRLGFVSRARSARNLGLIRHHASWPLLVRALYDDHPDVQAAAARALAKIGEPWSLSALIERLHAAAQNPAANIPLRFLRASLAEFPLKQASNLLPSMKHPDSRVRFLATDIIREMVGRRIFPESERILRSAEFSPELSECFLFQAARDESADVRARSAAVIACLEHRSAPQVLLDLLEDPEWFVRLHAVRALAQPRFLPQIPQVAQHLTDPHWRVRQAAVRTLLTFGRSGAKQIFSVFTLNLVPDCLEQIADEIQRAGLIPTLLDELNEPRPEQARQVIERLFSLGKSSCIAASLQKDPGPLRARFREVLAGSTAPSIRACLAALEDPAISTRRRVAMSNAAGAVA